MNTIIIIGLLLLGGGVAIYKFKASPKASAKKPAKKGKGNIVKKDDPFFEKNPNRDPLVKLAKEAAKKKTKKPAAPAKKAKKAIISAEEKDISREELKANRSKRRSKRNTKLPK